MTETESAQSPEHREESPSALDRPAARLAALAVLLICVAGLVRVHWDDLFPPEIVAVEDPAAACIAERAAGIDRMLADGVIDQNKSALFKSRAEALCRAQAAQ